MPPRESAVTELQHSESTVSNDGGVRRRKFFREEYSLLGASTTPELEEEAFFSSPKTTTSVTSFLLELTCGCVVAYGTLLFSLWFPFVMAPVAATATYDKAMYHYDPELSHFDNSAWTYGTDYALVVAMGLLALALLLRSGGSSASNKRLRLRSAGLLFMYTISVFAGGWAHHHYTTLESRNSISFRILWTICVGTVTAAGGFMGSCGSELARSFKRIEQESFLPSIKNVIPSDVFWFGFGGFLTAICAYGGISYQRPACDIFIAGTCQFPSTVFLIYVVGCKVWEKAHDWNVWLVFRLMCYIGFIGNAPLLPMYPLLIQYTDWSLASVNTLLHCWLCVAWGMQGFSLRHFCLAISKKNAATTNQTK